MNQQLWIEAGGWQGALATEQERPSATGNQASFPCGETGSSRADRLCYAPTLPRHCPASPSRLCAHGNPLALPPSLQDPVTRGTAGRSPTSLVSHSCSGSGFATGNRFSSFNGPGTDTTKGGQAPSPHAAAATHLRSKARGLRRRRFTSCSRRSTRTGVLSVAVGLWGVGSLLGIPIGSGGGGGKAPRGAPRLAGGRGGALLAEEDAHAQ